jgi:drug/metabolite transporter (DMT)-like permease
MLKGMSYISVGKSTLIFSTNPMFSMILAAVLLSETLSKPVIFSTLGAFVGIYFLAQNKENVEGEDHYLYIGIILVLLGAWFQALIFIFVRMVSIYQIYFTIRPFYAGMSFLVFSGLVSSFYRSGITFETYDNMDYLILSCVGIGSCI